VVIIDMFDFKFIQVKSPPEFFDNSSEVGVVNAVPVLVCVDSGLEREARSGKER
jgi:hypothetical protein